VSPDGVTHRARRVDNIPDPGKLQEDGITPVQDCPASTGDCISSGQPGEENDFCVCVVTAIDMSEIDADPDIITIFEGEDQAPGIWRLWIENTPKVLGWKAGKVNKIKGKLNKEGVVTSDLTEDSKLWEFANRIGRKYGPNGDVRTINPAKNTGRGA
jgi:hypothetical protein